MAKFEESEVLPHKKAGKNQNASSPKHGCPKNDYQPHEFVSYQTFYVSANGDRFREGAVITRCFDCGKKDRRLDRNKRHEAQANVIADVVRTKDGIFRAEFNKSFTKIKLMEKLDIE